MDTLLPAHPFLRHPHTGEPLRAIAMINGRPLWPVMGASPDDDNAVNNGGTGTGGNGGSQGNGGNTGTGTGNGGAQGAGGTGTGAGTDTDRGFPENTSLEDMTTEQQVAYWKFHARRHEHAALKAPSAQELAELRDKAGKYDKGQRAQMTELEKAKADNADLQKQLGVYQLADQRRDAATAAKLPAEYAKFITGATPEEMKASAEELKNLVGAGGANGSTTHATHDQGRRSRSGTAQSKSEAGMAEARKRGYAKPAAQTTQS